MTRSKKGFVAVWLRHAPAPLLWIHPIAKNYVLMPNGDSNAIFRSRGIFIVGTCPPMKMVGRFGFFDSRRADPSVCPLFFCSTLLHTFFTFTFYNKK
mgnify:CR=1 FL=1